MAKGHGRSRRRGRAPRLPELVSEGAPHAQDHAEEAARWAHLAAMIEALWAGLQGLGRSRRRGRAPRLPELVSEGAPHAQDRGQEAARRARLAAMIEALWAGLQGLGRLLRSFFARRQLVEVELPAAEEEEDEEVPLGSPRQGRQRQGGGLAVLYGNKLPPRRKREPRQPPPPPPSPLLMVKGESVSKDLEMQYMEYCRIRAGLPVNSCLCHMCFFEMPRHDHMTVLKREMIKHCDDMHLRTGKPCQVVDCKVRVSTERDYQLHMHFCHPDVSF